ncbi:uncharacterized protein FIBRA_02557 [Fibroporia radiculosa]|uniref:Aminotransferase class I/classII large domain-containing protein n=1 Tax=Fibroporia radiculosa TaxID=599839 RepID=J4G1U9_9APHY|nr:uncharacterized protein FIBRA_02557 [Fibroporia radiculosa]CCM00523.1 predicted protein [Fibroporia radiculosa]
MASTSTQIDLSHHLSIEARARKPNPMKAIARLARRKPNMVSLANGDPHSSLYPIRRISYQVASVAEKDPVGTWRRAGPAARSQTIASDRVLPVKSAMQYTNGAGLVETQRAITELTEFYHKPHDHVCTLTIGNGDGVTKCFRLLGSPGDHFLADEFSFSSLTNAALPQGIKWVPVKIDDGGLIPEELERLMENWDDRRGPRPHVLYTVPCGQNPSGSTLTMERRRQIYELAQRFDIMIIEDDPYYFLQYTSQSSTQALTPSFLSMDVDGRVMRVDSLSKVVAPGTRLGWITSNSLFHEHLISLTDSSTQHAHAFGQIFLAELLGPDGWGVTGFDAWVRSLRDEYQRRRDFFLDLFAREVGVTGLASAGPCEAGMFIWARIHVERHARYQKVRSVTGARTNCKELMEEVFERCVEAGLLVMPASVFMLETDAKYADAQDPIDDRLNYFRLTFAGTEEAMEDGLAILGQTLVEFFADAKTEQN